MAKGELLWFVLIVLVVSALTSDTFCPTAPAVPEDRRSDATKLRVVEFNVEFLFLKETGVDDFDRCPADPKDLCQWLTPEDAQNHLDTVAAVIKDLDADVIVLVELEDCYVLQQLIDKIGDSTYKGYVVKGRDFVTRQNVGLLTRIDPSIDMQRTEDRADFPVANSMCGSDDTGTKSVTKHFYTRLCFSDRCVFLVGIHFLAFPTNKDRCVEREAQATVIKNLVQSANSTDEVIVLGDFNDFSDLIEDTASSTPISQVLKIIRSSRSPELYNVLREFPGPKENIFSSGFSYGSDCIANKYSLIDHMLVSEGLKNSLVSVDIINQEYNISNCGFFPDHVPIIADFEFESIASIHNFLFSVLFILWIFCNL